MSKYAFITGATSGIGLATAKALAAGGYDLALAARNEGKLSSVKADIEKEFSVKVTPYVLDVREPEEIRKTVAACLAAFGAPDVLVNDAGLARGLEPYAETKEEDILQMIDTNIKGLFLVTRAFLPPCLKETAATSSTLALRQAFMRMQALLSTARQRQPSRHSATASASMSLTAISR